VGRVGQSFDPEFAAFMRATGGEFERMGQPEAAGSIEDYLWGDAGTGFVYVAGDGTNYIITSHYAITQASGLSISFERPDGTTSTYGGLFIAAADEELDIALLAFENGARPFARGLPLLNRPPWQGETVYSAGFPAAGKDRTWQFGGGVVSIAYIRIPSEEGTTRMLGPYIRHNARTDRDIPGGVLLVVEPGAPAGYAVAGINIAAGDWQTDNHAIPIDRVEDFLKRALGGKAGGEQIALEKRLLAFSRAMAAAPSYRCLAGYLANRYTAENAAAAVSLALENAAGTALEDMVRAFIRSPVEGINLAAAWAIENRLREGEGAAGIDVETIRKIDEGLYQVDFRGPGDAVSGGGANGDAINGADTTGAALTGGLITGSRWVNEYGIWRIRGFDESPVVSTAPESVEDGGSGGKKSTPRTLYLFSFSLDYGYTFDPNHLLMVDSSLHLGFAGLGMRIYYGGPSYLRGEGTLGFYFPVYLKNQFGITPFAGIGVGFIRRGGPGNYGPAGSNQETFDLCISGQGGFRLGGQARGLFLQAMYQYNYEVFIRQDAPKPHLLSVGIGYGF
jgi:serine protease Do